MNDIWVDITGHNHDGILNYVSSSGYDGPSSGITVPSFSNGIPYISGTNDSLIWFPVTLHQTDFTFFHVAKYNDYTSGYFPRILQPTVDMGAFGFEAGSSGVALLTGYPPDAQTMWITDEPEIGGRFGNDWVISTHQRNLYRANLVDYTVNTNHAGFPSSGNQLAINTAMPGRTESRLDSYFSFAELIVFDEVLSIPEIQCIEGYLQNKFEIQV